MKWISTNLLIIVVATLALVPAAPAQVRIVMQQSLLPADEARNVFNTGLKLWDEFRYSEAESKFREVIRRFPKNQIADRAEYYLIRTLSRQGKRTDALTRITQFAKQYPKSQWLNDVQELRIELTDQMPSTAETILLRFSGPTPVPAPPPGTTPAGGTVQVTPGQVVTPFGLQQVGPGQVVTPFGVQAGSFHIAVPPMPPMPPMPAPFVFESQNSDPEISLQQEIMRAVFRNNFDRAIEIATERLKANPADPVVLSSLNLVADGRSPQAAAMLLTIVKSSPNAKARRDAIFWLGRSRGAGDSTVDTLVSLLPTLGDEDAEAIVYSLSQVRSDKALNAVVTIARDKSKSERVRSNAAYWVGQSRGPNRVGLLQDIYKNSMDNAKVRQQITYALSQTRDAQAVAVMSNIAETDPDLEVRKNAVYWLGGIRSPEATQALERLLLPQKK